MKLETADRLYTRLTLSRHLHRWRAMVMEEKERRDIEAASERRRRALSSLVERSRLPLESSDVKDVSGQVLTSSEVTALSYLHSMEEGYLPSPQFQSHHSALLDLARVKWGRALQ